ncbi:MAG: hypothetical protein JXB19_08735 [Bacteroidales bacterium]|nr:hypothetical protein [Bacteroidales bacterium]
MNKRDDFDIFLENELKKSIREFSDDEFKNKVLERIPAYVARNRSRNLIIYVSGILSCLLFFWIIDFNFIRDSIIELYSFINASMIPSVETLLFIAMICFIIYIIPKVEYSNGIA